MSINKDKSMVFESDILSSDIIDSEKIDNSYIDEYKKLKLKVTNVKEEGQTGYKITKSFKNIDNISSDSSIKVTVEEILNKDTKDLKLFKRVKSFFKDTYTANIEFGYSEQTRKKYDITYKEENTNRDDNHGSEEANLEDDEDLSELSKIAEIESEKEFKFILNLPYSAVKSNASDTSNNEKTLIWELSDDVDKISIDFTFVIYNTTNIIILCVIGLIIIVGVIITIIVIKKKKSGEETLIHKDFDPSIADKVGELIESEKAEEIIPQPEQTTINEVTNNENNIN